MPLSASWTRGIDSAREPAVKAQADHPPQPIAIAVEKRRQRRLVAVQGTLEKDLCFVVRQIGHL